MNDTDGGSVWLDLERVYSLRLDGEDLPEKMTWQYLLARCFSLFELETLTRKAATRVV